MVKTVAVVGFVAAVAVIGIVTATRRTVIDGEVLANDLVPRLKKEPRHKRLAAIECEPEIPVDEDGARFTCTLVRDDGASVLAAFTMDRDGALTERILTRPRKR